MVIIVVIGVLLLGLGGVVARAAFLGLLGALGAVTMGPCSSCGGTIWKRASEPSRQCVRCRFRALAPVHALGHRSPAAVPTKLAPRALARGVCLLIWAVAVHQLLRRAITTSISKEGVHDIGSYS
ncbi:MAG: hypothetical protein ACP5VR_01635 [Acidimicrobiales bacterium]